MTTEAAPTEDECKFANYLLERYFMELAYLRKNKSFDPEIIPVNLCSKAGTDKKVFNALCNPRKILGAIGLYLSRNVFDEKCPMRHFFLVSCKVLVVKRLMPTTAEGVVQMLDKMERENGARLVWNNS